MFIRQEAPCLAHPVCVVAMQEILAWHDFMRGGLNNERMKSSTPTLGALFIKQRALFHSHRTSEQPINTTSS